MRAILLLSLTILAACAVRAQVDYVDAPGGSVPGATLRTILVGTTRGPDPEQDVPGTDRAEEIRYGRYVVSIPDDRDSGEIPRQRTRQQADPREHFMLAGDEPLSAEAFRDALRAEIAQEPRSEREAVVFVHGFNNAFIEGVYRTAQLDYDLQMPGVMLHYSWPSLGAPLAYAHDRDSALFARDGLMQMLRQIRAAGVTRITILAHSMGSQLTMETLRQMALMNDPVLRNVEGVILLSPDIDVELFRQQVRAMGDLPDLFVIVTSQRDRILTLSASMTGEAARLGNMTDPSAVADLDLTVIDVSAFARGAGHFTMGSSPELNRLLAQMNASLEDEVSGRVPLLPAAFLTLQNTGQVILTPFNEIQEDLTGSGGSTGRPAVLPWWLRRMVIDDEPDATQATSEGAASDDR
ncbi:alpha/beta hydrolase [Pararhodobacter marinus]|nr:alpha/beta fold hydrolase [Pararhodobacter marinus]